MDYAFLFLSLALIFLCRLRILWLITEAEDILLLPNFDGSLDDEGAGSDVTLRCSIAGKETSLCEAGGAESGTSGIFSSFLIPGCRITAMSLKKRRSPGCYYKSYPPGENPPTASQ